MTAAAAGEPPDVLTVVSFLFAWRKLRVGAPTPKMALDEAKKIRETVSAKSQDGR